MTQKYYITTPIYYVNDKPHIGHAYTNLACDVLARAKRLSGFDVKFLSGTDEHGQKIEKSAILKNIPPKQFVDEVSQSFLNLKEIMQFSYDDFIRTTDERHIKAVKHLWNTLKDNGYIYLGKYCGYYAVRDEAFYDEKELVNGKAPTGADVEFVEQSSYFFALSKFQDKLLQFYEENKDFISPKYRALEVINFVKSGLNDLSISRNNLSWGVKVPDDEEHVVYVWLDALTNYISAIGYPNYDNALWDNAIHMLGKDILRFHAIYWPAFLMAANITPPKQLIVHGWWTFEGQKMSKSLGNVVDPVELVEKYGIDFVRYYLLKEGTFGQDCNFSLESFINRANSELANNIGNLAQRTVSIFVKNFGNEIGLINIDAIYQNDMLKNALLLKHKFIKGLDEYNFSAAISVIIEFATELNKFIDEQKPWSLIKENKDQAKEDLCIILECIRYIGILLLPIIPSGAQKILDIFDIKNASFNHLSQEFSINQKSKITLPEPIFRKINN